MSNLIAFLPDERWCANLLRKIRWTRYNRVTCIYCHSQNIKKNGCYRSYQKFYCKCCKKNFNDKTDTIFHYSHAPLKKWFIVLYLFFVLWPGCSIFYQDTLSTRGQLPTDTVITAQIRHSFLLTYLLILHQGYLVDSSISLDNTFSETSKNCSSVYLGYSKPELPDRKLQSEVLSTIMYYPS